MLQMWTQTHSCPGELFLEKRPITEWQGKGCTETYVRWHAFLQSVFQGRVRQKDWRFGVLLRVKKKSYSSIRILITAVFFSTTIWACCYVPSAKKLISSRILIPAAAYIPPSWLIWLVFACSQRFYFIPPDPTYSNILISWYYSEFVNWISLLSL